MKPSLRIVGPYLPNKGDRLMVHAIREAMGATFALKLAPLSMAPAVVLRGVRRALIRWPDFGQRLFALPWARGRRGILDCSGFQYSDHWSVLRDQFEWRLLAYRIARKQGTKVVMLPQAFGPFTQPSLRRLIRDVVQATDLVYARDERSYEYVIRLSGPKTAVRLAPDFTQPVRPTYPRRRKIWSRRVCIVPNERMLDKTGAGTSARYMSFVTSCVDEIVGRGLEPVILVHERNDLGLARALSRAGGLDLVIEERSALKTKGILACCQAVIGSRYHALIGALAQGTPCLGTSWAHKYETLFSEFGVPEWLTASLEPEGGLPRWLSLVLDEPGRRTFRDRTRPIAARRAERSRVMWRELHQLLAGD